MLYVTVYRVDRKYGGPEEGGWWYNTGEVIEEYHITVSRYVTDRAYWLREQLQLCYPKTGKRASVLGGDDYDVIISGTPGADYPETVPHYE